MNVLLKSENFLKNGLTDEEVLYLLIMSTKSNIERAQKSLIEKGFITQDGVLYKDFRITEAGMSAINAVILDSDKEVPKESKSLKDFADSLRMLFPKGMQQGKYSWRSSTKEISERLRVFYREFGSNYTEEEIYNATKNYVTRMSEDPHMRTLPYFLWDKRGGNYSSLLANEIECIRDGETPTKEDWRSSLV